MSEQKLKVALQQVIFQELELLPDENELSEKYPISQPFQHNMDNLIEETNKKYIVIMDRAYLRNSLVLPLSVVCLAFIGILYFTGKINWVGVKWSIIIMEFVLMSVFGTSTKNISRDMTRSYKTAFMDSEENTEDDGLQFDLLYPVTGPVKDMTYILPQPPVQYRKTKEYRTVTEHTAEFCDGFGRTINYACCEIYNGVLKRIKSDDAQLNKITINNMGGTSFTKDDITHIVWADKHYLYHLYGNCEEQLLIEMAENMK